MISISPMTTIVYIRLSAYISAFVLAKLTVIMINRSMQKI